MIKILFQRQQKVSNVINFWDKVIMEVIEINVNSSILNRDVNMHLSDSWKPVLQMITC